MNSRLCSSTRELFGRFLAGLYNLVGRLGLIRSLWQRSSEDRQEVRTAVCKVYIFIIGSHLEVPIGNR